MNKTIIININGIIFHIEEDAYEVLRSYMTEVKRHFAYSPDSDEIVTDIENRIAEMFNERLAEQNKQVIVLQDVTDVTSRMGSVSDFDIQDPEQADASSFKSERKLYRDLDDRFLGGVCAGIGHYFDMEVKWVRLITVLITMLWGTGLIIYIILWIILPKATTRAEKMAMKGEPINLQNFKKNFDEEIDSLKYHVKPGLERTGDFLREAGEHTGNFLVKALHILIKIIGVFVIFFCSIALFSVLMGFIFAFGFNSGPLMQSFPFNVINPQYQSPLYFSAFVLMVIPLLGLLFLGIKVIFNRPVIGKTTAFALLIIWLTGLGLAVFYGSKIGAEFKEEAKIEQRSDLRLSPVYYIQLNSGRFLTRQDSISYGINSKWNKGIIKLEDDFGKVHFYIEKSDTGTAQLIKEFSARGIDFSNAIRTAEKTGYHFSQSDSLLVLDKYLYLLSKQPYRAQEVNITLKVPVNTRLVINGEINEILNNYNLFECKPENSPWEAPSAWVMTDEGLKCANDSLNVKKQNP